MDQNQPSNPTTPTPITFSEQFANAIETEVRRRVREILASEALRGEAANLDDLPSPDQPVWYGVVRKQFGWSRWKYLSRPRKVFLASFGKLLQDKAVERYSRHIDPIRYLLERLGNFLLQIEMSIYPDATMLITEIQNVLADPSWQCGQTPGANSTGGTPCHQSPPGDRV